MNEQLPSSTKGTPLLFNNVLTEKDFNEVIEQLNDIKLSINHVAFIDSNFELLKRLLPNQDIKNSFIKAKVEEGIKNGECLLVRKELLDTLTSSLPSFKKDIEEQRALSNGLYKKYVLLNSQLEEEKAKNKTLTMTLTSQPAPI